MANEGGTTTLFQTLYTYDGFHRPSSVTDAMGNETVFTYDEAGKVTTSVFGELDDQPGSSGNVLLARTTRSKGNPSQLFAHNIMQSTLRRMHIKENIEGIMDSDIAARACPPDHPVRCAAFFAVYQEDDVIEVERFGPSESPPFAKETTVIHRSPAGLVMNVTRNGDLLDSFGYDSSGALTSMSNAARTIDLNRDGRQDVVVCGRTDHFRVASPPTPKTYTHTITRDALGRITAVTDGANNASSFAYDSLGRCTSLADPGRPPVTFAYDGGDATGPYSVVAACDIDNSGSSTELGRCLIRCGAPVLSLDSNGYPSTFTYDALGRLTRCDLPDGTFATLSYDARGFTHNGRLLDASGTDLSYDALGRVVSVSLTDASGIASAEVTTYSYDGLGRLVSASQGASTVSMTWDSVGNPLSETTSNGTVTRTFNHRGRTSVTYPGAASIPETRNEFGQLTNAGGNLVRYVGMHIYQTEQTNGVVTTYSYRGEGDTSPPGDASYGSCVRVTSVSGATTLADTFIQHSPDQRVTKAETSFSADQAGPGRARSYTYDDLGRVTACLTETQDSLGARSTESDVVYTLDTAGRRLSVTGGTHPGSYTQDPTIPPGDRQMGQYTTWPGGSLEWDDRGNLTSFNVGPNHLDLDSDGDGRLVAVNDGGSGTPVVSYTYDALGRLASRTGSAGSGLPDVTTFFVWDGPRMVQELDDPDGPEGPEEISAALTFVCGDGGIRHCISTRNGTMYYPVGSDARHYKCGPTRTCASQIGLTSQSGALLERYDHDEAGELLLFDDTGTAKTTAIGPVRWMAPEALRDRSTGFVHGHGGVYSPSLGVVVGKDKGIGKKEFKGHVTLMK